VRRLILFLFSGLDAWDFDLDAFGRNLGILFSMGIVVRFMAWVVLKMVHTLERGKLSWPVRLLIFCQRRVPKFFLPVIGAVPAKEKRKIAKKNL